MRSIHRCLTVTLTALALGCQDSSAPPPTGTMEVTVATVGAIEDMPAGYVLNVDYVTLPPVGVNNAVTIPDLWRGQHLVYLSVPTNCVVAGENPRWVEVVDDTAVSAVSFSVTCSPQPPSDNPWDY